MAVASSPGSPLDRPTMQSLQGTKIKMNHLFAYWLTGEGEAMVRALVEEMQAAAKPSAAGGGGGPARPAPPALSDDGLHSRHSGGDEPRPSSPTNVYIRDAHRASSPTQANAGRFYGVDEVEMHRAMSPGGASPMSPTTAASRAHHVVDPSLPLGHAVGSGSGHPSSPERNRPLAGVSFPSALTLPAAMGAPSALGGAGGISGHTTTSSSSNGHAALRGSVASHADIGKFFVPKGQIADPSGTLVASELEALAQAYSSTSRLATPRGATRSTTSRTGDIDPNKGIKRAAFSAICTDVLKIPAWLRDIAFKRILAFSSLPDNGPSAVLRYAEVKKFYDVCLAQSTPNRRLFEMIRTDSRNEHITLDDLIQTMHQLVILYPGLNFLTQREFQDLYCKTAAVRIIYELERNNSRRVTWFDFNTSDLPDVLRSLDDEADINRVLRYFSYEHFYVLYCRFFELDTDKDHLISVQDLSNYNQGQVNSRVLERVVLGKGRPLSSTVPKTLDFEDFIYFCLSEEDKTTAPAKRYWFQVLDLDDDGIISGHELNYFLEEQRVKFNQIASDELKLEDILCQTLDMIGHSLPLKTGIRLTDLKKSQLSDTFLNFAINATKFMMFEQRDPFSEHQMRQAFEKTPWDRFARVEYDRMAQEAQS